jgi:hypothetical protein
MADQPEDHSHPSHVPITDGKPTLISVKQWIIDIAWQAANNVEWDDVVFEITEDRHGAQHGAPCPGTLLAIPGNISYSASGGKCPIKHDQKLIDRQKTWAGQKQKDGMDEAAALAWVKSQPDRANPNYNDFHSWCGDYATWVFWKAWVLKGSQADVKSDLAKFMNRETLTGKKFNFGNTLNLIEAYAKGFVGADGTPDVKQLTGPAKPKPNSSALLVWHQPGDGYVPSPGDYWLSNRAGGGHIGMVASVDSKPDATKKFEFVALDGKSYDQAFPQQGVVRKVRSTDPAGPDLFKGFIDTANLRKRLGYR